MGDAVDWFVGDRLSRGSQALADGAGDFRDEFVWDFAERLEATDHIGLQVGCESRQTGGSESCRKASQQDRDSLRTLLPQRVRQRLRIVLLQACKIGERFDGSWLCDERVNRLVLRSNRL